MKLTYTQHDKPALPDLFAHGTQWLIVCVPSVVIMASVMAQVQGLSSVAVIHYMQRMFMVLACATVLQMLQGHRLALVPGPASVLLVAAVSMGASPGDFFYSGIVLSGLVLLMLTYSPFLHIIVKLFTRNIIASVLILIAVTLIPAVLSLLRGNNSGFNYLFCLILLPLLFFLYFKSRGFIRSTVLLWGILAGSVIYYLFQGYTPLAVPVTTDLFAAFTAAPYPNMKFNFTIAATVLISFIALMINDIGSISATAEVSYVEEREESLVKGLRITGVTNTLAGIFGVIGPVNYSYAPGIILSTGNASRFTLIPVAIVYALLAAIPQLIVYVSYIPSPVIALALLYVLCLLFNAGVQLIIQEKSESFNWLLTVSIPVIMGATVTFLPAEIRESIPLYLRPILANGFTVGVFLAFISEHLLRKQFMGRGTD